ncbi:MAG: MFS transporter [Desulfobacterales bacterium]|nr:MFS transporter [Desulfobacterales bacterium]
MKSPWAGKRTESYVPLLFVCCTVTFGCYFAAFMRLPVVPLYARTFGTSTSQIGVFNSAFYLMAGLLSFPMGMVSDRIGSKSVAAAGLIILSAASFLLVFCDTFALVTLVYLVFGIGIAAFGPTMMAFVAEISPPTHLGRSYGWYTTAIFCGMSFGPATGGFIAQRFDFVPVFVTAGAGLLAVFLMLIFLLPKRARSEAAAANHTGRRASLAGLFRNRPLVACWLVTLGACFGLGMFLSFIPLHAQNQGLNAAQIGMVFFAQGIVNGLSRIPFGQLSDHVSNRSRLVTGGVVVMALSMAGLGASQNAATFMASAALMGVGMGLAFTSIGALIAESVPAGLRGMAMGGYNTCIYLGMMISSAFMGPVNQAMGFKMGFVLTALVIALFAGLFFFIFRSAESASASR